MQEAQAETSQKKYNFAIRRPVTISMVFLTLVVFGWYSYERLPINLMPDISYPTLTVRSEYEGAAPEDVEKLVTRPLEEQLSIVSGLVELSSTSSAGVSEIVMEFTWGTDMNVAQQDVRDRLDLYDPPKELTEKPVILRYDPSLDPVFRLAITGEDLSHIADPVERDKTAQQQLLAIREAAERYIKSDLEAEIGIAQVEVKGGREQEIEILIDAERLKNIGVSVESVAQILAQHNINMSGGMLREGTTEYLVRTKNEWEDVSQIGATIIGADPEKPVQLSDVATIRPGEKDRKSIVRVNGNEAVELDIYKWGDANTVQVCNRLKDLFGFERERGALDKLTALFTKMPEPPPNAPSIVAMQYLAKEIEEAQTLRSRLPDYAKSTIISDQSLYILSAIDEVKDSAIQGGLLSIAILYIFLRRLWTTVIIGIAIPISIVTTFVPMYMHGMSLNVMSLGGLAMGVGVLLDNSVVVMESIFRCQEEGDGLLDAANRGTKEVFGAVIATTVTTVAVFLPIAFVEGVAGQLFRDHALVVTYSVSASMIIALYLNPMIASRASMGVRGWGNSVWFVRVYRMAYADGAASGIHAFGRFIPNAILASATWFLNEATANFNPAWEWTMAPFRPDGPRGLARLARIVTSILVGPPLLIAVGLLFALEAGLKCIQELLITLLLLIALTTITLFLVVGKVIHAILWLPLWLFNKSFTAFRNAYGTGLRVAMRLRFAILILVTILAVHSATLVPTLGRELIPAMRQGEFGIEMQAPPGTRLEETERRAMEIERLAKAMPEIGSVAVEIGDEADAETTGGESNASFTVRLANPEADTARQDEIMDKLRAAVSAAVSDKVNFTLPSLLTFKSAIELQVQGDDYGEMVKTGHRVADAIRTVPGVKDSELNVRGGFPEVMIEFDRRLLASKQVTPEQLARRLRSEVQGEIATELDQQGDKVDIRVRTDRSMLNTLEDLRLLSIVDGSPPLPLSAVAKIHVEQGPSEIRRLDQHQVAIVTANVTGRDLGSVMDDVMTCIQGLELPEGYTVSPGGQDRELRVSYSSLQFALALAVFLVYVTMACQFESIVHPLLVMTTVPLASIGVIYTLYALNVNLSVSVYIGAIVLAGIVVDNAIVLVDYINQLIDRGLKKREAIVEAAKIRMRPILITALTTGLGMLPLAIGAGQGDEVWQPLAITVIAGLASSTILTLVVIPVVFDLFGGRNTA